LRKIGPSVFWTTDNIMAAIAYDADQRAAAGQLMINQHVLSAGIMKQFPERSPFEFAPYNTVLTLPAE
jgi:hypothetical protein